MNKAHINLDPVNDGVELKSEKENTLAESALIIATDGQKRTVGFTEAMSILEKIKNIKAERLGNTDYIALYNGDKIVNFGNGRFFIGSVLILRDSF